MSVDGKPPKPAELLEGLELDGGWTVGPRILPRPCSTGGHFSIAYQVARPSSANTYEGAFLKALDFTAAGSLGVPLADALQYMTKAYVFERDLVLRCAERRMRNVVIGVDAGQVNVEDARVDPTFGQVPYIIFERADGDVRDAVEARLSDFDEAWAFRILHGVANGLRQLHQEGIAHQDLKPSNVMSFGGVAKVGDLGRASSPEGDGLYDAPCIAGDLGYAPPELLYGEYPSSDRVRRLACDAYHLGSMVVFMYTGSGLTPLIDVELAPAFHWRTWPRDYRNVLPYVRNAYDYVLASIEERIPPPLRSEVVRTIRELTDPDPLLRGHPAASEAVQRFSMERYVSRFDLLARRAELSFGRAS
jgi:serine/threonine protein kinase